jgi:hypothetical protein
LRSCRGNGPDGLARRGLEARSLGPWRFDRPLRLGWTLSFLGSLALCRDRSRGSRISALFMVGDNSSYRRLARQGGFLYDDLLLDDDDLALLGSGVVIGAGSGKGRALALVLGGGHAVAA